MNDGMNRILKTTDLLWGGTRVLDQEGRKLGLRDDGELWVGAADVPFPVRVLRWVGRWTRVSWVRKKMSPLGWWLTTTNLWWPGWNTSPVENLEGAAGSKLGEGGRWISLDRRRPHRLLRDTLATTSKRTDDGSGKHPRNFFQKPFGLR